jgi:predicted nucleic acid-binding protein
MNLSKHAQKTGAPYLVNCMIAATAKAHGLILATENKKDYPMKDIEFFNF